MSEPIDIYIQQQNETIDSLKKEVEALKASRRKETTRANEWNSLGVWFTVGVAALFFIILVISVSADKAREAKVKARTEINGR